MLVEMLVGNIASGKSQYSKLRAKQGAVVIDHDEIITMVHGGDYSAFDINLLPLYRNAEYTMISNALALKRDVVIDRTHHKISHRRMGISIAKIWNATVVAVVFPMELAEIHATRRMESDDRALSYEKWLAVANKIKHTYIPPTKEEGFDFVLHPTLAYEVAKTAMDERLSKLNELVNTTPS